MMQVTFLRHTRVAVPSGLCYGSSDVPLHADYAYDLARVREALAHKQWGTVYSSPAQRCHRLALDLAQSSHVRLDERLRELHFGDWEGRLWQDIKPEESLYWTEDFVNEAPPGGESYQELWDRCQQFFEELMNDRPPHPILIVTHSGIIRAFRCRAEGRSLREAFDFPLDYGAHWDLPASGLSSC